MAVYPALAAPEDTAEQAGEEDGLFQVRESPLPVQSYDSGGYRIDVYGAFTQMTGPDGAVTSLEDSRLLYKRGTMLSVSSEFDFYGDRPDQVVVDSVSGEGGTTQYLSVLESDRSLEDYYTQIEWPGELPNSNIVEISSTLDTSEPVLMVRYSDNTVAAFNYVTGSLLFKDDSEKREIGFGEYLEGWFAGTWDSLFGSGNTDYSEVEDLWGEAQTGVFDGFFPSDGSSSQGGDFTGGEFFLTEEGANLGNGGQAGADDGRGGVAHQKAGLIVGVKDVLSLHGLRHLPEEDVVAHGAALRQRIVERHALGVGDDYPRDVQVAQDRDHLGGVVQIERVHPGKRGGDQLGLVLQGGLLGAVEQLAGDVRGVVVEEDQHQRREEDIGRRKPEVGIE